MKLEDTEVWHACRRLVSDNTVSDRSNAALAAHIAEVLESTGLTVSVVSEKVKGVEKASVVAWVGPPTEGGLIISGHMDVVPFDNQPGWRTDPLVLHSDGERVFGRGVSDMKAFLAQAMVVAKRTKLDELKRPLVMVFTCDEEWACQGSGRLVDRLPALFTETPMPKVALIGEPTNFDVYTAHKGYATLDIVVRGKGGHSSTPDQGASAIEFMADVVAVIKNENRLLQDQVLIENRRLFPEYPFAAFNVGMIGGGLAPNMIADVSRLTVSLRTPPGDDPQRILSSLQNRIMEQVDAPLKKRCATCGVTIEDIVSAPPMLSDPEAAFCKVLKRCTGKTDCHGAAFATDGGQFQRLGIQSYICGPGLLSEAHQPNESLPISNLLTGVNWLESVVIQWCLGQTEG